MLKVSEILEATSGILINGKKNKNIKRISTDSRKLKSDDFFIPLKGENFDGHDFLFDATKKGASGFICEGTCKTNLKKIKKQKPDLIIIKVKNCLTALQRIAKFYRQKFDIPIIGITGSSGKTTTKDMLASILSQELKVLKTKENQNNEIGVPLTILGLKRSHRAAVIEMAIQKTGDLEILTDIVRPTIAIITNIGEAHLKYLKTEKKIALEKAEILKYLEKNNWALLPQDSKFLKLLKSKTPKKAKIKTFGILKIMKYDKFIHVLPLPGKHHIYDALAAITIAKILKIKDSSIIKGLKSIKLSPLRMEFIQLDEIKIINDTYNANPSSMRAALLTLVSQPAVRRIAILGDMFELGKEEVVYHQRIGNFSRKLGIDLTITIGKLSKHMQGDIHFSDLNKAIKSIKTMLKPGDVVLVKASRRMHLEKVVDSLRL